MKKILASLTALFLAAAIMLAVLEFKAALFGPEPTEQCHPTVSHFLPVQPVAAQIIHTGPPKVAHCTFYEYAVVCDGAKLEGSG